MENILIGITGSIAAYKTADMVSDLVKKNYNVKVIMTKNATRFISPLTFEILTKNKVYFEMFSEYSYDVEHISLTKWADILLIVPASFNIVGKIANGIADDILSTVISAFTKKVYFALAMNTNMYQNKILNININKLKMLGYEFIESDIGRLACKDVGLGKLATKEKIYNHIFKTKKLYGKNILITAGRTQEAIDPVRYLSNKSTGKMGYEIAKEALRNGANVTLISGPTYLLEITGIKIVKIESAFEMYEQVNKYFETCDVFISCAAVSDYKIEKYSKEKIKKKNDVLQLNLIKNPDILLEMSKIKNNKILVGFAAESENIIANALEKLNKKKLDYIIANDVSNMGNEKNSIIIISKKGDIKEYLNESKMMIAKKIINYIFKI